MDYTLHEWVRMASHHGSIARCAIDNKSCKSLRISNSNL